ncbi:hypothetical protein Dvar_25100 [Desulfosarcina variabilis str. Montpellier]|uniref:putative zinc-binding protein n=1 Tax=Desulfosarcina variabilis TaxID=2300 RepID=UPI003AFB610B
MLKKRWRLFLYTCFGGCATGVSASKACIRLWEENPEDVKIACLPAVVIPGKLKEMLKSADKRLLVDACSLRCGAKLFEREGMTVDTYLELTSQLKIKKEKILPSADLQEKIYLFLRTEVHRLLQH